MVSHIVESLSQHPLRTRAGNYVTEEAILRRARWHLDNKGFYDVHAWAVHLDIEVEELLGVLSPVLRPGEHFVGPAGLLVTDEFVASLRRLARRPNGLPVTTHAKHLGMRRGALMALLRDSVEGKYESRSDRYVSST